MKIVSCHRLAFLFPKLLRVSPTFLYSSKRGIVPLLSFFCASSYYSKSKTTLSSLAGEDNHGNMESGQVSSDRYPHGYLNAKDSYQLDVDLFSSSQYTLEQLMELAGLSVAEAAFTMLQGNDNNTRKKKKRILVICGPGNNGGDGLVAARHLIFFGFDVDVMYPKRSNKEVHYEKLLQQCLNVGVNLIEMNDRAMGKYDGVVDAIFGFSFSGIPREPFKSIIEYMISLQIKSGTKVISVDIPSGWNVDEGDLDGIGFVPDALVSLTAPKLCSKKFNGRHFVGGRFLPDNLAQKYNISMPQYSGVSQVFEIKQIEDDWAAQYAAYCGKKEATLNRDTTLETVDEQDWKLQYHKYLLEKEAKQNELDKRMEVQKFYDGGDCSKSGSG